MRFLINNKVIFGLICLLIICSGNLYAQNNQDSLSQYSYLQLDDLIYSASKDSLKQSIYLDYYYQKAKRENNNQEITFYYRNYIFFHPPRNREAFIDSAFHYAYQTKDKGIIGKVYVTKGVLFYNLKDYQQALDNYLKANYYFLHTDDLYNKYRVKVLIALLKNYLGYYEDAERIFNECITYYSKNQDKYNMQRGYISSMEGLSWTLTKTNRVKESNKLLKQAFDSIQKYNISELDAHYNRFRQGINDYFLGNYDQAIQRIEHYLPFVDQNEDIGWATIGNFYIGKSYWQKKQPEKAFEYFDKVHQAFEKHNYTHPDFREGYELLINYYKSRGDKDKQLKYIEQLVKVDSSYNQTHKYLVGRIHKEYETQELLDEKRSLEASLYVQKNKTLLISLFAFLIFLISVISYAVQKKKSKQTAKQLIRKIEEATFASNSNNKSIAEEKVIYKTPQLIKDDTMQKLLAKLDDFEVKHKFRKPDISLEKLAKEFDTNTTYLSTIINTHKNKKFNDYINSLRIDYFMNEVITNSDSEFYRYSMEGISKDLGFSSSAVFSRVFQKQTQTTPSLFLKELRRKKHLLEL